MDAKEARARLLDGSRQVIDNILIRASGIEDELGDRVKIDNKAEALVLSIIAPMMQAESDARKMDADSALSRGDVSAKEAVALMGMLGVKSTIDTERGILLELQKHAQTPVGWE